MPEYCVSMMRKEELDGQFFDDDAVISSIAIFSYEPAPPEDMGFFAPGYKKLENREERKKWRRQSTRLPLLHRRRRSKTRKKKIRKKKKTSSDLQLSPCRQSLGEWSRVD